MRTQPLHVPYLIDNIDVRCWYYRDAPTPGDIVNYMNEDFIDTVARVTTLAIWFESGHAMRRPYLFSRLCAWITAQLSTSRPRYKRQSNTLTVTTRRLRPDMTLLALSASAR